MTYSHPPPTQGGWGGDSKLGKATKFAGWRNIIRQLCVYFRGLAELAAVLLRGLPVGDWGDEDASLVFWGLGLHLGRPGAQNPQGERLGISKGK